MGLRATPPARAPSFQNSWDDSATNHATHDTMSLRGGDPEFTTSKEIFDWVLRKDPRRRSGSDKRVLTWRDDHFPPISQVYKDAKSQEETTHTVQTASLAPQKAVAATPEVQTSTIDQLCSEMKSFQTSKVSSDTGAMLLPALTKLPKPSLDVERASTQDGINDTTVLPSAVEPSQAPPSLIAERI